MKQAISILVLVLVGALGCAAFPAKRTPQLDKPRRPPELREAPVIRLGADGEPLEIRFGTFVKGPFDVPAAQMDDLYRAYRRFSLMTKDPAYQVTFRLSAGDLMAFDNRRILHARTAFEPSSGERHLRGCYMDTDELLSRIRVLERRFPPQGRPDFVC